MTGGPYEVKPIGWVESPLVDRELGPKQGDEGSPDAWLAFDPSVTDGLRDLQPGAEVIVLTWLHQADRDVLRVHPRDDLKNPEQGVFSTRSPDRPNPIGLHRVEILSIEGTRIRVRNLEVVDGTPVVDVKPTLDAALERYALARFLAIWRSSAASRPSHWAPTSAIQATASDIGAGVGR